MFDRVLNVSLRATFLEVFPDYFLVAGNFCFYEYLVIYILARNYNSH